MIQNLMTHASLFSGIGGFDLAAQCAGFENLFNCEIDPFCRKVLNYHFPNSIQYGNIKTTDFTPWRGKIDILTGGFPCQPFSLAGQRKGTDDDRYLWPEMLRAISEIRPAWVIGENVGGIVSMVQSGCEVEVATQGSLFGEDYYTTQERQVFIIERICRDIEHLGYSIQPILIPACSVGAPHRRDRVWFVAENTLRVRRDSDQSEEAPRAGGFGQFGTGDHVRVCRETGIVADPRSLKQAAWMHRGFEANNPEEKAGIYDRTARPGDDETVADPHDNGSHGPQNGQSVEQRNDHHSPRQIETEQPAGCTVPAAGVATDTDRIGSSIAGRTRNRRTGFEDDDCGGGFGGWQNFPTQSPVCCGNDGLSARLDIEAVYAGIGEKCRCTANPYPRWRQAAIKGFGNAIVPQVAFQIMQAIKDVELKQDNP